MQEYYAMINHISIAVNEPERVANVLAELWDGIVFPFPPAPDSFFVIANDGKGTAVEVTPAGKGADVNEDGIAKFFGSQSSMKKPIVVANWGSTCGLTVVVSVGSGGGVIVFFLSQEENTVIKSMLVIKLIPVFVINVFFLSGVIKFFTDRFFSLKNCCKPKNRPATF